MTVVRAAQAADWPAVVHAWRRCYHVESDALLEAGERRWRREDTRVVELEGALVGCGRLLPLSVWLGGRDVGLGGIASLATLPEARRRGVIGALLSALLGEMRERGMALSALYPFDSGFYHRYGWALADTTVVVRLPARALVSGRPSGRVVEVDRADAAALAPVHERWARRYNLSLRRDPWWWERYVALRDFDSVTGVPRRYLYRYDAPGGEPEGYVVLWFTGGMIDRTAVVHELCAVTPRARAGLLSFVGDLDSQAPRVELRLAAADPLRAQLASFDDCEAATVASLSAMARIVDLEALVAGARVAGGDAAAVVAVRDRRAAWNDGGWRLAVEGGAITAARSQAAVDAEVSVQTATQLVTGMIGPAAAIEAGLVAGPAPERVELLARLAGGRAPYHVDTY